MVCRQAYDHLWNHFLLGPLTSGLCYGISTSSNQDGHLHGNATRDSNQAWKFQGTCFEARKEYLRPETGWARVEFIPRGQTHVHRIHNVATRWLRFLLWWHHIHGVRGQWYLPRQRQLATSRSHQGDPDLGHNIEDQGHPAYYVGVNIKKLKDGPYEFTQQASIDSIINDVRLKDAKVKLVPAKVSLQLHVFKDKPAFDLNFNYKSAVGKFNYLSQTTRPDIMYVTHQIDKY